MTTTPAAPAAAEAHREGRDSIDCALGRLELGAQAAACTRFGARVAAKHLPRIAAIQPGEQRALHLAALRSEIPKCAGECAEVLRVAVMADFGKLPGSDRQTDPGAPCSQFGERVLGARTQDDRVQRLWEFDLDRFAHLTQVACAQLPPGDRARLSCAVRQPGAMVENGCSPAANCVASPPLPP
jgi:hypothetical protein